MRHKTLIIAEAGINHNGDVNLAKKLVDIAVIAGADIVKFQTFTTSKLTTSYAKQAEYQDKLNNKKSSQYEMLKSLELSHDQFYDLFHYCEEKGIEFLSTGFDEESLDFLVDLGIKRIKIPSGEITNLPLLRKIAKYKKPIILSTGMASLFEIELAFNELKKQGIEESSITILQCTSEYPTPMSNANLLCIKTLKDKFKVHVGFSDHTQGIEASIASVALGAFVVEKHFTLDQSMKGPDHSSSLNPEELKVLIKSIRNIELALGDGVKSISLVEKANSLVVRKSIVASRDIIEGETLTIENITSKRPGKGISPMHWDDVLGTLAKKNFSYDDLIEL